MLDALQGASFVPGCGADDFSEGSRGSGLDVSCLLLCLVIQRRRKRDDEAENRCDRGDAVECAGV